VIQTHLTKAALLAAAAPLAIAFAAAPAMAQTAAAPAAGAEPAGDVEAIVVTGSLFRRTNIETPSPVTVLTAEAVQKAGLTTAAEAIRTISADGAGSIGTGFQGGFSAGGSAVSLRNLGVSSTLVLIDGLRSTNFPINDDGHNSYVDLNSLPFSNIEKIEVLKDGASSVYGADAIGGVVNLITKKQFTGVKGSVEGGQSSKKDAGHFRTDLTVGYGDYNKNGWNLYLAGEYQRDGRVTNHSRGFPYNDRDLTSIGGLDQNTADSTLTTATPSAVVTRVGQTDLNNPFAGMIGAPLTTSYQLLNPACPNGSYTVTTGAAQGTGCKYNLQDIYNQIAPLQEKYGVNGRLSIDFHNGIEGWITGSFSHSMVDIKSTARPIRDTQPFGASPALASSNPGVVLPVYVCSSGVNCATAGDRRLNPNNPFAAAFAGDPANGAARIYYLFGDLPFGSHRTNEVVRGTAGLTGTYSDDWHWRIEGQASKDNLELISRGYLNIAGLKQAINTGAYNFVSPALNTEATRDLVSPDIKTPSFTSNVSLDASVTHPLAELAGGDLQLAFGGQIRKEVLENNNQNVRLDTLALSTASSFGKHTVAAAFAELDAPVLKTLDINLSGRYDHYSEGFGRFSPKVGFKWTPDTRIAFRGTFSKGFRAPTFPESNPRSQFSGFASYTPPAAFQIAHGGLTSAGNTNGYAQSYQAGQGVVGNPDLKPEISTSFTGGVILQPWRWLSATVDYYNVKKSNLIVTGPDVGAARAAYYGQTTAAAGCAAVAAFQGYSCNVVDAVDPQFPNALPRLLIVNAPFVNANFSRTSGVDFQVQSNLFLTDDLRWTSRAEVSYVIQYDLHTPTGVQKYAGTLGPYELSSGNGTPRWRGNWQNTLEYKDFSFTATAYYVGKIKSVAADDFGTDCVNGNPYATGNAVVAQAFCTIKSFINVDLNASYQVRPQLTLYANVGNVFARKAPIAPGAYTSNPNYLTSWHYAGLIGRTWKVGASYNF
jgi:iron complex outermembrane receptor protein